METKGIAYKRILAYKHINTKVHTKSQHFTSLALQFTPSYAVWDEMTLMNYDTEININLAQIWQVFYGMSKHCD